MPNDDMINELGLKYLNGVGVPVNYAAAMNYFKKAAHIGNSDAMVNIGKLYQEGLGVVQNNYEALGWYKAAANKGNIEAMYLTARLYNSSNDIPQNKELAIQFYEKAANSGYEDAMFPLACLYDEEFIYFQNMNIKELDDDDVLKYLSYPVKSFKWFKKAAELGNIEAMFITAQKYENFYTLHNKKNESELANALKWYFRAADAGHHQEAMFRLARIFDTGCYTLVPIDKDMAWYWYRKAANSGQYEAMYKVGRELHKNHKYSKAFEYFFKAAHAGHYDSMLEVGLYYLNAFYGNGPRNIDKGRQWLLKVANCGNKYLEFEARTILEELDEFLEKMRQEEIRQKKIRQKKED